MLAQFGEYQITKIIITMKQKAVIGKSPIFSWQVFQILQIYLKATDIWFIFKSDNLRKDIFQSVPKPTICSLIDIIMHSV